MTKRLDVIHPLALGCPSCPEFTECGGLYMPPGHFRCTDACEGGQCKPDCDVACPNNPDFLARVRAHVGGFEASDIEALLTPRQQLPRYVSGIEHGYSFEEDDAAELDWVMIPLRRVIQFDRTSWRPVFSDGTKLRERFRLAPSTRVIVSCIDIDPTIVCVWRDLYKRGFLRYFLGLNLSAVVVPNFSVFDDEPRFQHMYNRKRSLIVAEEFSRFGIEIIPYCHGLSPPDWEFWRDFLISRPDVTHLAKEFQTGLRSKVRGTECLQGLAALQDQIGRNIHLVSIGGAQYVDMLAGLFDNWTLISQKPFVSAVKGERIESMGVVLKNDARIGANFVHNHQIYLQKCADLGSKRASTLRSDC